MATSGSIDYSLNARQVITFALQKINLLALHEDASGERADNALVELNMMCKEWMKYENLWRLTEGFVTLVADTASYTLAPDPHRVVDVRYRDVNSRDLPMYQMGRQEYFDLPVKTIQGIPTQYFFDKQRTSTLLYVWPLLSSATTETLRVSYQRKFEDVDSLDDEIDIPQEYFSVVAYNLAARLADSSGRTGAHIDRVIARAEHLLQEALDDDRPDFIQFMPDDGRLSA